MIDLEDLVLEHLLVVAVLGILIEELPVLVELEQVRLHAADYSILVFADGELELYHKVLAVDGVHQLRLVHLAKRLVEQNERQGVEQRGLARSVVSDYEGILGSAEVDLSERVTRAEEVLPHDFTEKYDDVTFSLN